MTVLIRASHLFDGTAATPDTPGAVLVDGDHITAVGRAALSSPASEVIDLGDRTLMPGLVDSHVHLTGRDVFGKQWPDPAYQALRSAAQARTLLENGVTTARDCGGTYALALSRVIEAGELPGPRLFAAGPALSQTGGHWDWRALPHRLLGELDDLALIVDGVDQAREAVRRVIRRGSHFIKICTSGGVGSDGDDPDDEHFSMDEIRVIVEEAHRARRRVASHAQGEAGILNAVRAGVDSIEHGYFLDEECAEAMQARGTHFVPTLNLMEFFKLSCESNPFGLPDRIRAKQERCISAMERSFRIAQEAGLSIAAGSDNYGPPGREIGRTADEVVTMTNNGMPALDALRAATSAGARVIGVEDQLGELRTGMLADVIAVQGRPWENIAVLREVQFVMKGGDVVRSPVSLPGRAVEIDQTVDLHQTVD